MTDRRIIILAHPEARRLAIEAVQQAPEGYGVVIKPSTRSLEQNALLHAELTEISATREWFGSKRSIEVWKRLLTAAWMRARGESVEVLPALDGHGADVVFRRTSELTKAELSELIEYIRAWSSE
jgi:hypothetical protein